MFQPGGEDHTSEPYIPELIAERLPQQASSAKGRVAPTPAAARVEQPTQARERMLDDGTVDGTGDGELIEAPSNEPLQAPASPRIVRWNAKSWIVCSIAVVLVFAASAFCLFAAVLVPSASSLAKTPFHGVLAIPWGQLIYPGGPALCTAGLGMLSVMFLMAARFYSRRAWWFHAAAALVALVALAVGGVTLFSEQLFTAFIYDPSNFQGNGPVIQWYSVFLQTSQQMLTLGPALLAVMVILHPGKNGAPGRASAKTTFWTGAFLTAAGVWMWFSPQLFPLAQGARFEMQEQNIQTSPWTYSLSNGGAFFILVGVAVLFWWILILATTQRLPERIVDESTHGKEFSSSPEISELLS